MQLRYGTYSCPVNGTRVARRITALVSDGGQPYGERHRWDVAGELLGSGQADLIAQMASLRLSLGQQYQDLTFFADDGSVAFYMPNTPSLDGVKILEYFEPGAAPNEFATQVAFQFAAEATYLYGFGLASAGGPSSPAGSSDGLVLDWQEVLQISGGGPRYGFTETVNGAPVKSLLTPASVCRAVQRGSAEGLVSWPRPASQLWPQHLSDAPDITRHAPQRAGQGLAKYRIEWSYLYASPVRLDGQPSLLV